MTTNNFKGEYRFYFHRLTNVGKVSGCVLVYRFTKERNINELRHNSMYGYENNRNSPVYRYTRTAPSFRTAPYYCKTNLFSQRKCIVFVIVFSVQELNA